MIKKEHLDFWLENNYNVLFIGPAGVGKTSIVKDLFEAHNLKWRYFSASTMDPWVDFIGVPKEKTDSDGNGYLDLVRPKEFQDDEVEALFFDEYNRAHKKIRNAVMELIQFKSINGKRFKNLRVVWAAINPADDEDAQYDVDELDPAQEDRFHIKVEIQNQPVKAYFIKKYGKESGEAAISWWRGLPAEQKKLVSPRRLDYAVDIYSKNGDVRYVLPSSSNITKFCTIMSNGPIEKNLKTLLKNNDAKGAEEWLSNENNYSASIEIILKKTEMMEFFVPQMPKEKISVLVVKHSNILNYVTSKKDDIVKFDEVLQDILEAGQNRTLCRKISRMIAPNTSYNTWGKSPYKAKFNKKATNSDFDSAIKKAEANLNVPVATTVTRRKAFEALCPNIPQKLTTDRAAKALSVISNIAARSHPSTLNEADIMGVTNHCIEQICSNERIPSLGKFVSDYSSSVRDLFSKVSSSNPLRIKIYNPNYDSSNNSNADETFVIQWE